jgi:hypothetical protein
MLVAAEVKGELARIRPARLCCRRAELIGLLQAAGGGSVRTLDPATARTAFQLASSLGIPIAASSAPPLHGGVSGSASPGRHHLRVPLAPEFSAAFRWRDATPCDRRAFLRGLVLSSASISFSAAGPHVEFVLTDRAAATALVDLLGGSDVRAGLMERRGRQVVYLKGQEHVATLLRLTGANRAVLEFESSRVGRDVQNRLNRLVNAEEANLERTVRAADRQLQAIRALEAQQRLGDLSQGLREAALQRRRQPDADLDTLASSIGIGRSAMNHRLRRIMQLAAELDADLVHARS